MVANTDMAGKAKKQGNYTQSGVCISLCTVRPSRSRFSRDNRHPVTRFK